LQAAQKDEKKLYKSRLTIE